MASLVRLATRGSELALHQTGIVATLLQAAAPEVRVEPVVVHTEGDRRAHEPLEVIGGQGVFVKEIQAAVLEGRADAAVHSAKDLPPLTPQGLVLAAVPERADPRDALVGLALSQLPEAAVVATGSPRRRAQLANLRPDLHFVDLRGNIATRLGRVLDGTAAAIVTAVAALERLGLQDRIAERLSLSRCLPQVGQGALAVECRADDHELRALLASVDDPLLRCCLEAERGFLSTLGAGCQLPVAAFAERIGAPGEPRMLLRGVIAAPDGSALVRGQIERAWPALLPGDPHPGPSGGDAGALGAELAHELLVERGGAAIVSWPEPGDHR